MNGGFVIPRTTSNDAIFRNLSFDSRDAEELINDLNAYKGSSTFDLRIGEITSVESVCNSKFLKPFSERRAEMRDDGCTVRECYAFAVVQSHDVLESYLQQTILDSSIIDTSDLSLVLGDPTMGVHVFKTAEAALLHYGQYKRHLNFSLLLLKVILAKGNVVKAQPSCGGCLLEPQPSYDHHLTRDSDNNVNQLLYIFEYNSDAEIVHSPRSILPVALFNYNLSNGEFKRNVSNANSSAAVINTRRNRSNNKRVADIIRMKKEQALAAAAIEEARRLEAEKIKSVENSPCTVDNTMIQKETDLAMDDRDEEIIIDDVDMEENDSTNKLQTNGARIRGPSLTPLCADIINQCGYDPGKSLDDNRQALALSNSSGVAFNTRTIQSLRRSGRAYCKEKKSSKINSIVQICRQLPQESQISAAFHLVIGFLRYQLGDSSVQLPLPKLTLSNNLEGETHLKNVEIQCDLAPEVSKLEGPDSSDCPKKSATVTCSVMIQCNLNKLNSRHTFSNVRQLSRQNGEHNAAVRPQLHHPHRPSWSKINSQNKNDTKLDLPITSKPLPTVLDEPNNNLAFNNQSEDENDENFVLRLIIDAITDGIKKRPSSITIERIEEAFYSYLNSRDDASQRDYILLDLANHSQQGRWQLCLEKIGIPINLVNDNIELAARSRRAGQMWAQTLTSQLDHSSESVLTSPPHRKLSRYSDNIFEDSASRYDDRRLTSQAFSHLQKRSFFTNSGPHNDKSMFPHQISSSSGQSIAHMRSQLADNHCRNLSIMNLRQLLFQRKSTDLANMLRVVNNSRQCGRFDEIALYSHLLNLRKP